MEYTREQLQEILDEHIKYLSDNDGKRADLREADLRGANLYGADLREADLYRANLRRANLYGADLCEANLYGANLYGAENISYIPIHCPTDGAFIGWKKASGKLVKLLIPEGAKRLSATTGKCRCDRAMVLEITSLDGEERFDEAQSGYDPYFIYRVGETVCPKEPFNEYRWDECSSGIHFFIDKQEAIDY